MAPARASYGTLQYPGGTKGTGYLLLDDLNGHFAVFDDVESSPDVSLLEDNLSCSVGSDAWEG